MKKKIKIKDKEQGAILIVATMVSFVMLILATPFLLKLSSQNRITVKSYRSLAALNLAEAGAERAIWELFNGDITTWSGDATLRSMTVDSFQDAEGNVIGDFVVNVHNPESSDPVVEATGSVLHIDSQAVDRTVRVVLEEGFESFFEYAVFVEHGLDMSGNAFTDSYNSEDGDYDEQIPGNLGSIGTNSTGDDTLLLFNNTEVNGRVDSGYDEGAGEPSNPDDVIELRNQAEINGDLGALDHRKEFPVAGPPEDYPDLTPLGVVEYADGDVIEGSGLYTSFYMPSNSVVTIDGGGSIDNPVDIILYIQGDGENGFHMESNTELLVVEGTNVLLVMNDGDYIMESNAQVNVQTLDPKDFMIFGTEQFSGDNTMEWNSNAPFYGVVLARDAVVNLNANVPFHGALVCDFLDFDAAGMAGGGIHYDESLGEWDEWGVPGPLEVKSWQERIGN